MEGSRLFILSEDQSIAHDWVDAIHCRMRARKLLDKLPGVGVVAHAYGTPATPFEHRDRLFMRDALSRGSMMHAAQYPTSTYTLENLKIACDDLIDEWSSRQRRAAFLREHVGGTGDPYGKILIVYTDLRACMMDDEGSRKLSALLDAANLREPELYFINGALLTREKGALLTPYEIVALGKDAQLIVESTGIKSYVAFPNPKFFTHDAQIKLWGAKLRALVESFLV